jgi:hypothetical protein
MLSVTSHIFHDASKYFKIKLEIFHELYCDSLLAIGFPKSGTSLLEVDFSMSDKYSEDLFQDILVDLTFCAPLITIDSYADKNKETGLVIYYLDSDPKTKGMYMIESVINYNKNNKTACKIHELFPSNILEVNSHWL